MLEYTKYGVGMDGTVLLRSTSLLWRMDVLGLKLRVFIYTASHVLTALHPTER